MIWKASGLYLVAAHMRRPSRKEQQVAREWIANFELRIYKSMLTADY